MIRSIKPVQQELRKLAASDCCTSCESSGKKEASSSASSARGRAWCQRLGRTCRLQWVLWKYWKNKRQWEVLELVHTWNFEAIFFRMFFEAAGDFCSRSWKKRIGQHAKRETIFQRNTKNCHQTPQDILEVQCSKLLCFLTWDFFQKKAFHPFNMATLPTFSTGTWSSETTVKLDFDRWSFEALVGMDGVELPCYKSIMFSA